MLKPRSSAARSGFTLVELIVAMAILVIIVAALGQIMGTASNLTTNNNKHTDANGRARTVFDRMANDFARMVKRNDADIIFGKNTGNDTMFFYTEGASYYDGASPDTSDFKNAVSLVGYRVDTVAADSSNGQLQRLGKALLWDGATTARPSMLFLTYPVPENQASGSAAYTYSTLSGGTATGPAVGTSPVFNDGTDASYHPLASNVFRFEYSFQLKDGTQSNIPVMQQSNTQTPTPVANGVPFSSINETGPPTTSDDITQNYVPGSRWYDSTNKVGYICVDATKDSAVWHEIGIQDISAIVVTIAVLDDQGMVFLKNANISLATVAQQFGDSPDPSAANPDPATDLVNTWILDITPAAGGTPSLVSANSKVPQAMVSQIRIFQRFFYINNT